MFQAFRSRMFRRAALGIQSHFNDFDPATRGSDVFADRAHAPIFILGPPRTGSTLIIQALIRVLQVNYISNLMSLVPRHMIWLNRFNRFYPGRREGEFHPGNYGFIPGLFAPSEAGKVMDHWFDPSLTALHEQPVRRMFITLSAQANAPVLIKSLSLTLKTDVILEILPETRFLVLSREPAFAIQSLLLGRLDPRTSADQWSWVVAKKSMSIELRDQIGQIARQYARIVHSIQKPLEAIARDRVFHLSYDRFCAEPAAVTNEIGEFWGIKSTGYRLARNVHESRTLNVKAQIWEEILRACEENGLPQSQRIAFLG